MHNHIGCNCYILIESKNTKKQNKSIEIDIFASNLIARYARPLKSYGICCHIENTLLFYLNTVYVVMYEKGKDTPTIFTIYHHYRL